jgi:Fe2+ transport system protein FeoA
MLLDIYLSKDRSYRCVASLDAMGITGSMSVHLRNGVPLGGVREIRLSGEQVAMAVRSASKGVADDSIVTGG